MRFIDGVIGRPTIVAGLSSGGVITAWLSAYERPWLGFIGGLFGLGDTPPQSLKEYDPEWVRAFWTGTFSAACPHDKMLAAVKVPVMFTHHLRVIDETSGALLGAVSDLQVERVRQLITATGNLFEYRSFPQMGHSMHGQDPQLYTDTLVEWANSLASPPIPSPRGIY